MVDGATCPTDRDIPVTNGSVLTRGFFDVMGMRLLQGRDFLPGEVWEEADPTVVVSKSFARRARGGGVGGIGDDQRSPEYLYVTPATFGTSALFAAVRTQGPQEALAPRVRAIVTELDRNLPVDGLKGVPEAIQTATWAFGLCGSLFTLFGAAALFMASVGL